jgi:hypothetical protein
MEKRKAIGHSLSHLQIMTTSVAKSGVKEEALESRP